MHQHDHEHSHRHVDAPHGGRLISLDAGEHVPGVRQIHLEVMPIRDGVLVVYPLGEQLGVLRAVKDCPGKIMIRSL